MSEKVMFLFSFETNSFFAKEWFIVRIQGSSGSSGLSAGMNFFSAGVDEQAAVRELREAAPAGTVLWGQDLKAETPGSD